MAKIEDMWMTPGARPNGLQAAADGLWVISADEGSHLYKLDYETGDVIVDVPTETYRSSGLTVGGGHVWVASTHSSRLYKLNEDGSTVEFYDPPGTGVHDPRDTGTGVQSSARDGVGGRWHVGGGQACASAVPDRSRETLEVERSIPTPGAAPHGIAWDGEALWCADRAMGKIHRLDAETRARCWRRSTCQHRSCTV